MSKRKNGSVVVATSYLNSYFGYNGIRRRLFKKYPLGLSRSVDMNLQGFIDASKQLADDLKNINASLILDAPIPEHPGFTPDLCSRQWFRISPSRTCLKTERDFAERQRKHIIDKLELASRDNSNVYIFDPFEKFCDDEYCYGAKHNIYRYVDYNHLSKEGGCPTYLRRPGLNDCRPECQKRMTCTSLSY